MAIPAFHYVVLPGEWVSGLGVIERRLLEAVDHVATGANVLQLTQMNILVTENAFRPQGLVAHRFRESIRKLSLF